MVELCVLFISIFQKRIPIVQYPLMASPILNILMVLGMALVSGGLVKQRAKNTTPKGDASEELSLLNATGAPAGVSSNPAESSTTKPPERRSLMARLRILNRTAKQKEQARMVTPMENLSYYYQVIAMIGNPTAIKSQATMALVLALTLFAYAWTAWFMEDYPSRHQRFLQAVGLGIAVLFWGVFAILMYYQFVTHKEDMEADQQPPRLSEPRLTRSRTHSVNPRTWQDGVEQRSRANSANSNSKRDDGEGTSPARTPVSPSPGLLGIPGKQPSEGAVEPSSSPAAESTTSQTQGDNATAPTEQKKWRKNMTVEEIQAEEVAAWKEVWGEKPNFVLLLFGFLWLPRPKLLPKVPKKGDHESDEHKKIRRRYLMYCFQMLAMASLITGFLCQFAVTNLEAFAEETGLNIYFVLGFLQPFIGNVVEHVTAVVQAIKGNVDLAYGICLSSSLQLMLVLIPLVPIFTDAVGARTDKVLQLFLPYDPWIATMLLIACVTLFAVSIDTEYGKLLPPCHSREHSLTPDRLPRRNRPNSHLGHLHDGVALGSDGGEVQSPLELDFAACGERQGTLRPLLRTRSDCHGLEGIQGPCCLLGFGNYLAQPRAGTYRHILKMCSSRFGKEMDNRSMA